MQKKELKDFINKNGFFFHLDCNILKDKAVQKLMSDTSLDMIKTGVEIPTNDDVIIYKWIASQNYEVWKKSRNWYKYLQKGWNFVDYLKNPLILFQHNTEAPIWRAISFWYDKSKNLNIMFFVYKDTLDGVDRVRVEKWLITAISTGAQTDEYKFEDSKSWELISEEEVINTYWFEELMNAFMWESKKLIFTITKATMIENSLVTIWSNEEAMAIQNWISQFANSKLDEIKLKYSNLEEEKEEIKEDVQEEEKEEVEEEVNEVETKEDIIEDEKPAEIEEIIENPIEDKEEEEIIEETKENEVVINEIKEDEDSEIIIEDEIVVIEEVKEEEVEEKVEEEKEESDEIAELEDNLNDNQIKNNDLAWNIALDSKLSDFEIKINDLIKESINNSLSLMLKDYISVEKYTQDIESLKDSFKNELEVFNNDLTLKINSLSENDEATIEIINDLLWKLKKTVFSSAMTYVAEKPANSLFQKKIEEAKNLI